LTSLTSLHAATTQSRPTPGRFQHTLQAFADFTGELTAQVYALPSYAVNRPMFGGETKLPPEADEVRREIRALKGLVLNRYVGNFNFWVRVANEDAHPVVLLCRHQEPGLSHRLRP
jgi:hypothetical protein